MNKTIVVDSDAIFALYNPNDPLNTRAIATFQELRVKKYQLLYPTSVLFEVISLFQRVLSNPRITVQLAQMVASEQLPIVIIDKDILRETLALFNPLGSKKNTLIDCSVAAVAKHIAADGIFSYDEFYIKQGLHLAEQVLQKAK